MALVGATEASQLAGTSRTNLYRLMKSGKLSFTLDANGERRIDTAELMRVFGQLSQGDAPGDAPLAHSGTAVVTPSDTDLVLVLKAQLAAAEERERRLLGLLEQMALPAGRSAPAESTKPWWKWWT